VTRWTSIPSTRGKFRPFRNGPGSCYIKTISNDRFSISVSFHEKYGWDWGIWKNHRGPIERRFRFATEKKAQRAALRWFAEYLQREAMRMIRAARMVVDSRPT
jgi:hypothetical protein